MKRLAFVMPESLDDPRRPSGGNVYDRRVADGLRAGGWAVTEHPVPGRWPCPDDAARRALEAVLAACPSGSAVLVDGLVASAATEVLAPHLDRLRLVVLVHLPLGSVGPAGPRSRAAEREAVVLRAASAVLTTSTWTADWVRRSYAVPAARVHVATPGVDPADTARCTPSGGRLLCVAAVTHGKGHDVLVEALSGVRDLAWECTCVGSLDVEPRFAARVRSEAAERGLHDRLRFVGPLVGPALAQAYAAADLCVLPSRGETYGMVLVEALARGMPVLAPDAGGVPEALGDDPLPGVLVRPGDPAALGAALRDWLEDPDRRAALRSAAATRRGRLQGWEQTTARVVAALTSAGAA